LTSFEGLHFSLAMGHWMAQAEFNTFLSLIDTPTRAGWVQSGGFQRFSQKLVAHEPRH
jgi:hypothetical protein